MLGFCAGITHPEFLRIMSDACLAIKAILAEAIGTEFLKRMDNESNCKTCLGTCLLFKQQRQDSEVRLLIW